MVILHAIQSDNLVTVDIRFLWFFSRTITLYKTNATWDNTGVPVYCDKNGKELYVWDCRAIYNKLTFVK